MESNCEFDIKISELAWADYLEILDKIGRTTLFEKSVEKWANLLYGRMYSLKTMPKRFAVYKLDERFRSTNVGKYKIIYCVNDDKRIVTIARIVYARRNLKKVAVEIS
ncbi:type II toxin-antitoxin system RelE/ParE family toxin [Candidatus Saccharibacteria bacterium]|nr:type II toxin-antitoxin system RelE/ParE family toxin [Candidatus Saccharibacteria bacterium]